MLTIGTLFTGIGAWEKALIDLGIEFKLKWFCEVDKYAIQSYCAMYSETNDKNIGDITKVGAKELDDVDIIFYSPPCQAFSVAGKQLGFEDKRGVLFYDALKIIAAKKPKVAIMENVKGLTGKKFKVEFEDMLKSLEDLGYKNSYKVLNAKDYEIPQNRERVFIVSVLDGQEFEFPEGVELKLRLKDILENVVDEKYYVSEEKTKEFFENNPEILEKLSKYFETSYCIDANYWKGTTLEGFFNKKRRQLVLEPNVKQIGNLVKTKNRDNPNRGRIYDVNAIGPALNCMQGGGLQPYVIIPGRIVGRRLNKLGKRDDYNKDIDIKQKFEVNENDNYINTLTTVQKDNMICINYKEQVRVRKYQVDVEKLKETLKSHKKNMTVEFISIYLDVKKTTVEHWFRSDNCFSIPDPNIWFELKELLNISTNEFDKSITEFEEREGAFEKADRCYFDEGIYSSVLTSNNDKIVENHNFRIRRLTPRECWRLQGFNDADIQKCIVAGVSESQLYKQAGNSICVNVPKTILNKLLKEVSF